MPKRIIFGQDGYGSDKQYVNYDAFAEATKGIFLTRRENERLKGKIIAMPYSIGCGFAGRNIQTVHDILCQLSWEFECDIVLYRN